MGFFDTLACGKKRSPDFRGTQILLYDAKMRICDSKPAFSQMLKMIAKVSSKRQCPWGKTWSCVIDALFAEGTDAIRRVAGSSVGLMTSEGLSVKRFSEWLADADEGLPQAITTSDFLKPHIKFKSIHATCMTDCIAVMSDKMAGKTLIKHNWGGFKNKDFLQQVVRELSRLLVERTNGQEQIWIKDPPPNWPKHLKWKNPSSSPKDTLNELEQKYDFLRQNVSNDIIPETLQILLGLYDEKKYSAIPIAQNLIKAIEILDTLDFSMEACQDNKKLVDKLLLKVNDVEMNLNKSKENTFIANNFLRILPNNSTPHAENTEDVTKIHPQNQNIVILVSNLRNSELKNEKIVKVGKRKLETIASDRADENSKPKRCRARENIPHNNVIHTENITSNSYSSVTSIPLSPGAISDIAYQQGPEVDTIEVENVGFSQPMTLYSQTDPPFLSSPTVTSYISRPLSPSTPLSLNPCTLVSSGGHSPLNPDLNDGSNVSTPSSDRSNDSGNVSDDSSGVLDYDEILNLVTDSTSMEELENLMDLDILSNFC